LSELPRPLRWYLWAIATITVCLVSYLVAKLAIPGLTTLSDLRLLQHTSGLYLAIFVLLAYVGERTALSVTAAISQSLSTVVHIAAILILPAPYPALITLVAVVLAQATQTDKPLYKRVFNICHPTLAVILTTAVLSLMVRPTTILHSAHFAQSMPMLSLLLLVYYTLDVSSLLGVLSLLRGLPPWTVWWDIYRVTLLAEVAAGTIGVLGAMTWYFDPLAPMLVVLPVVALRLAFRAISQAEDRAAALRRRGEQLEAVLKAGRHLRLQNTQASLLHTMADAARVLTGTAAVTGYLRDPHDPTQLERIVRIPAEADDNCPLRLPISLAKDGVKEEFVGDERNLLVPLELEDEGTAGLLRLTGIPKNFNRNDHDALGILATQAAIALQNALLHERALAQASTDGLTGLLNHKTFQTRLREDANHAVRTDRHLCMMMIDLDDFKLVNDTYGHQTGDALLIAVAGALNAGVRSTDIAARYGGDEFAVIMPETNLAAGLVMAERVRAAMARLRVMDGEIPISIRASIGVAELPMHAMTRDTLIRAADQAAYAAKQTGKGKVCRPEDALAPLDQDSAALAKRFEYSKRATVEALAAAVDAKDPYTRGHSQRVSTYAGVLAETMGLSSADVLRVRLAGLLHDVGKIGVPDAILTKTGKLSDEELASIKQHPAIGERMLSPLPFLSDILPAVRHHHERWDGLGYPDGLSGNAIPRDAAILMVADSFDAMTSNRTYRTALPLEEAARRVREGCGTQFDPSVVAAFERAVLREELAVVMATLDVAPALDVPSAHEALVPVLAR
jgi:diguanylate cyclase (GGDEF)-like protein/putative nucleotidyltransferase with HDIG domain